MEKFGTAFKKGDSLTSNGHIQDGVLPRYFNVWNAMDGKDYTVGDNGERRERVFVGGSIKHGKVVKGNLTLEQFENLPTTNKTW